MVFMSLLVNKMYYPPMKYILFSAVVMIFIREFTKLHIGWLINVISQVPE